MNTQFDNMIQVLTYFANQCDMFRPMLEGVESLQQENIYLRDELEKSLIIQNRMQLNTTFAADYANFGVITASLSEAGEESIYVESAKDDLYNLFKSVICVGKDNYDRADMEYKLDFYSMIDKIDFDRYTELWDLIDSQHAEDIVDDEMNVETEEEEEVVEEEQIPEIEDTEAEEQDVPVVKGLLKRRKSKKQ